MNSAVMNSLIARAEVLVEALPYIRAFSGKYFVVKYGGQAMVSDELMAAVIVDIVLLKYIGVKLVLVHGGGREVSEIMQKLGKQPQFVEGLRVTDDETMEIVEMVLMGKVNQRIVSLVGRHGGRAIGLSGKDAGLLQAKRRAPRVLNGSGSGKTVDLGRVGDVVSVDPALIHTVSDSGYIPVVSSIGFGPDGESLNINADHVAGQLAVALQAEKLIILTDVDGVYRQSESGSEFISTIREGEIREMIAAGQINGGMIPKVEACIQALEGRVTRTHIVDGRVPHCLLLEIFTREGIGTMVTR